ncbi:MAG TPA: hypothetical protein PLS53_16690 [Thermoanaerobaculaceae bacterium]|nr:hypothetical protein [Thermoanaerobaculaceae bacterium]HPS79799.1 hypothetical protein [Thermoanaerobaculaceae bacterium]
MTTTTTPPRYLSALLAAIEAGVIDLHPGAELDVEVLHDDDCDLLNGLGACNCLPELHVRGEHG